MRRSPPSYLATNDCGLWSRLATSCWVSRALFRASIISLEKALWPSEWTDLSNLRARAAIGADGLILGSDYPKKGYKLTLLLHSLSFHWTSWPREANCRQDQFGCLLWKTSKIWRMRSRQSVLRALRRQVGSQFIRRLSPGIFPVRLRQWGVVDRVGRLNRPRRGTSNSVRTESGPPTRWSRGQSLSAIVRSTIVLA